MCKKREISLTENLQTCLHCHSSPVPELIDPVLWKQAQNWTFPKNHKITNMIFNAAPLEHKLYTSIWLRHVLAALIQEDRSTVLVPKHNLIISLFLDQDRNFFSLAQCKSFWHLHCVMIISPEPEFVNILGASLCSLEGQIGFLYPPVRVGTDSWAS